MSMSRMLSDCVCAVFHTTKYKYQVHAVVSPTPMHSIEQIWTQTKFTILNVMDTQAPVRSDVAPELSPKISPINIVEIYFC